MLAAEHAGAGRDRPMTPDPHITVVVPDLLMAHTASWLLRRARSQLAGDGSGSELGPPPAGALRPNPATVILTIFAEGGRSTGSSGQGDRLVDAVLAAGAGATTGGNDIGRLQLDIVQGEPLPLRQPGPDGGLPDRESRRDWQRMTSFQDGMIVAHEGREYWLVPNQIQLQGMARVDRDVEPPRPADVMDAVMLRLGLPLTLWRETPVSLWRFQTSAWIEDAAQERALPLVQGIIPIEDPVRQHEQRARAALLHSATSAGDYLVRTQKPDGSFIYTLDPWLATRSRTAYNVVRHSGTTAALLELYAATGEEKYRTAGERALAHQATWFRPGASDGLTYVEDRDGKGKLGAVGLALVALTRWLALAPGDSAARDHAVSLARQLVAMQNADGSFESYLRIKGDEPYGSVSLYYPGEAMLALARLARLGQDDGTFMPGAHRGAAHLIASRQGRTRLPPDAWLMQALELLHQDRPDPSYVQHAVAISHSMLADQYGPDTSPAYQGGFGQEPVRTTRTTARVEGLSAAVRLAARAGHPDADALCTATLRTAKHLMQQQYGPDNSYFLAWPDEAAGAMRGGVDDAEIRIDYVQHHISAMLGLASLLDLRKNDETGRA